MKTPSKVTAGLTITRGLFHFVPLGDVSTQLSCWIPRRRCVSHGQAGTLVFVVCNPSRYSFLSKNQTENVYKIKKAFKKITIEVFVPSAQPVGQNVF